MLKISDRVFDGPSQAYVTIVEVSTDYGNLRYRIDAESDDPTHDGSFLGGWRNADEIGENLRGNFYKLNGEWGSAADHASRQAVEEAEAKQDGRSG